MGKSQETHQPVPLQPPHRRQPRDLDRDPSIIIESDQPPLPSDRRQLITGRAGNQLVGAAVDSLQHSQENLRYGYL